MVESASWHQDQPNETTTPRRAAAARDMTDLARIPVAECQFFTRTYISAAKEKDSILNYTWL
jgi:hypothetical protein